MSRKSARQEREKPIHEDENSITFEAYPFPRDTPEKLKDQKFIMTQKQLATLMNVHRDTIQRWSKEAKDLEAYSKIGRNKLYFLPHILANKSNIVHSDEDSKTNNLTTERARLVIIQQQKEKIAVEKNALALALLKNEQVLVKDVEKVWSNLLSLFKTKLETSNLKLSQELEGVNNISERRKLIKKEHKACLEELSKTKHDSLLFGTTAREKIKKADEVIE